MKGSAEQAAIGKPLSVNCTVPAPGPGVTVAVKVTGWPTVTGLGVAMSTVVVGVAPPGTPPPRGPPPPAVVVVVGGLVTCTWGLVTRGVRVPEGVDASSALKVLVPADVGAVALA